MSEKATIKNKPKKSYFPTVSELTHKADELNDLITMAFLSNDTFFDHVEHSAYINVRELMGQLFCLHEQCRELVESIEDR